MMHGNFPVIYLLSMVAIAYVSLKILNAAQKEALNELSRVLNEERDFEKYLRMLASKRLSLVFRKGTIELMRLDGYVFSNRFSEAEKSIVLLDRLFLSSSEKLSFLQKRLSYYVATKNKEKSYESLSSLSRLLLNKSNSHCKKILQEATLLVKTQF